MGLPEVRTPWPAKWWLHGLRVGALLLAVRAKSLTCSGPLPAWLSASRTVTCRAPPPPKLLSSSPRVSSRRGTWALITSDDVLAAAAAVSCACVFGTELEMRGGAHVGHWHGILSG